MADPFLASMLVQRANVYHFAQSEEGDGQLTEAYSAAPDILGLPCMTVGDGKTLTESAVGFIIESDLILWCEDAALWERDKVVIGNRVFYVNGTPVPFQNPWTAGDPNTPHLLEVGLKEEKVQPA